MDASPPPEEVRGALERLYRAGTGEHEHGPRHPFLVATDHQAELCNKTVALVANAPPPPPRHDSP